MAIHQPDLITDDRAVWSGLCNLCGEDIRVEAPLWALKKYNKGALVQDAFSMLTEGQREFMMSRFCSPCYTELFSGEDN